ncbi:DUF5134 domain-containing protein [Streptomyces sp. BH-SS-21]|uniref:DUF5134 domain-containing protein n=1 Tax=Streptomyces liliiviolaceus TaxID=2823109 RepID=A0A940XWW5_9ACTN|nr:DUF5134 domain-containing protein [Streptomyces liliiviolaceus]MBQ0850398.1 DUF5134 domain-containing protein [Streptomyces liliiviolaceus]
MSDGTPAVLMPRYLLTALFTVVVAHTLWHGLRSADGAWRARVDHFLHAAMALTMAVMPWSWGRRLPVAAMTVFFVAAALWFALSVTVSSTGRSQDRATEAVSLLPHMVGMAAMAWMLHAHHLTVSGDAAGFSAAAPTVTAALALVLLGCSLRSLTQSMPPLRAVAGAVRSVPAGVPYQHVRDGAMALGAAVMLLMPH